MERHDLNGQKIKNLAIFIIFPRVLTFGMKMAAQKICKIENEII